MKSGDRRHLWSGFWSNSLGTLASRVLGLVRDMATAALLGLGESGVMDALVIAFRVPNLLRRIFGEGALAASFLPVFTAEHLRDPRRAWQLTTALLVALTVVLGALALVGEALCGLLWWSQAGGEQGRAVLGLTAVMLPYMVFICLAAQAAAALQGLLEFRWPALAPSLLNVCWLAAAWWLAPWAAPDKLAQAYILAAAVVFSGVLQLAVLWVPLRLAGFRWDFDWPAALPALRQVVRSMVPIVLGLAVTQVNTLVDSLIAWGLSAEAGASQEIAWLGGGIHYPMQSGAAAAVYFGERFYQFPVGVLGVAVATVIYPLLSRHAARGDRQQIGADLTLGLRLVWFLALPAAVGIMLVARPLTSLLFERGQFTAADSARAARMIAGYASGVWAYCALPVLVRGFYAVGNRAAPARLGMVAVGVNLALNLTLIWPLAELGLAVATAAAAALQVVLLVLVFSRSACPLLWRELAATLAKSILAVLAMALVVSALPEWLPTGSDRASRALALGITISAGAGVYLAGAWLLRMSEPGLLLRRPRVERDA